MPHKQIISGANCPKVTKANANFIIYLNILFKDQVLETILSGVNLLEEHVTIENKLDEATKCLTEYYAFKKDFQEKEAKDCILMVRTLKSVV